jgi:hypothetical protein
MRAVSRGKSNRTTACAGCLETTGTRGRREHRGTLNRDYDRLFKELLKMRYGSFEQAVVHQEVRSRCKNAIGDVETIVSATLQFRKRKSSAAKSLASEEGPVAR